MSIDRVLGERMQDFYAPGGLMSSSEASDVGSAISLELLKPLDQHAS